MSALIRSAALAVRHRTQPKAHRRRVVAVLCHRHRRRRSRRQRRRIVHRRHVERDRVRALVKVYATARRTATVLHRKLQRRVTRTVRVRHRLELQQPRIDVRHAHELVQRHRHTIVRQRPGSRQRSDLHRRQRVRRAVLRVTKPKVRRREHVRRVLHRRQRLVRPRRRIVHRSHVKCDRVRRRVKVHSTIGRPATVLHRKLQRRVSRPARVSRSLELQQPRVDVRHAHELVQRHRHTVVRQRPGTRQRRDLHRRQHVRRTVLGIAKPEIRRREHVCRVLHRRDRLVRSRRRIVHRCHGDHTRLAGGERSTRTGIAAVVQRNRGKTYGSGSACSRIVRTGGVSDLAHQGLHRSRRRIRVQADDQVRGAATGKCTDGGAAERDVRAGDTDLSRKSPDVIDRKEIANLVRGKLDRHRPAVEIGGVQIAYRRRRGKQGGGPLVFHIGESGHPATKQRRIIDRIDVDRAGLARRKGANARIPPVIDGDSQGPGQGRSAGRGIVCRIGVTELPHQGLDRYRGRARVQGNDKV